MRKRTSPTILEWAILAVPEFEKVLTRLSQQVTLRGQSKSTLDNFVSLKHSLHRNLKGEAISPDQGVSITGISTSESLAGFHRNIYYSCQQKRDKRKNFFTYQPLIKLFKLLDRCIVHKAGV